ncbi:ferredoxin [Candidatus Entotheonella serta]|nr:ferredoxin [Candidatus Entotheonella serta]
MADSSRKVPENAVGPWYVDDTCVPGNLYLDEAPALLKSNEDETHVDFAKQPENQDEEEQAR